MNWSIIVWQMLDWDAGNNLQRNMHHNSNFFIEKNALLSKLWPFFLGLDVLRINCMNKISKGARSCLTLFDYLNVNVHMLMCICQPSAVCIERNGAMAWEYFGKVNHLIDSMRQYMPWIRLRQYVHMGWLALRSKWERLTMFLSISA